MPEPKMPPPDNYWDYFLGNRGGVYVDGGGYGDIARDGGVGDRRGASICGVRMSIVDAAPLISGIARDGGVGDRRGALIEDAAPRIFILVIVATGEDFGDIARDGGVGRIVAVPSLVMPPPPPYQRYCREMVEVGDRRGGPDRIQDAAAIEGGSAVARNGWSPEIVSVGCSEEFNNVTLSMPSPSRAVLPEMVEL